MNFILLQQTYRQRAKHFYTSHIKYRKLKVEQKKLAFKSIILKGLITFTDSKTYIINRFYIWVWPEFFLNKIHQHTHTLCSQIGSQPELVHSQQQLRSNQDIRTLFIIVVGTQSTYTHKPLLLSVHLALLITHTQTLTAACTLTSLKKYRGTHKKGAKLRYSNFKLLLILPQHKAGVSDRAHIYTTLNN